MAVSGNAIADFARTALGVKYIWGGNSLRQGIDCSGLVQQVYKKFGIDVPRVTYDQINVGYSVPVRKLRPGDLVFFDTDRQHRGPDHVGIYLGAGKFIHAPRPGDRVKISSLADSYYMSRWMGGRRIPGVVSGGGGAVFPLGDDEVKPVKPKLSADELAEEYGMSYALFKSNAELWKLLKQAVADQWTDTKFQAELKNSKWWRATSSSRRKALLLQKSDPATYKAQIEAARVAAQKMAVGLGAVVPAKQLDRLAKNMVHLEWDEAQTQNFLGKYVKFFDTGTLGGLAGKTADEIRRTAHELGVAVTEQSILNNAQYIVRGVSTLEKTLSGLRQQAAGLYPGLADQIKAGASVTDLVQPYQQVLASELGLPETDLTPFNPRIKQAVNRLGPDGLPQPMSITDFTTMVRDDPSWQRSPATANKTMGVARQVLADLGLVR